MRSTILCIILMSFFLEMYVAFPAGRAGAIAAAVRRSRERKQKQQKRVRYSRPITERRARPRSNSPYTPKTPYTPKIKDADISSGEGFETPNVVRVQNNSLTNNTEHVIKMEFETLEEYPSSGSDVEITGISPDQRKTISEHLRTISNSDKSYISQNKGKIIFFSLLIMLVIAVAIGGTDQ
eukprot:30480_1